MWIKFTIVFVEDARLFARRTLEDAASTLLDLENVKSQEQACQESSEQQKKASGST